MVQVMEGPDAIIEEEGVAADMRMLEALPPDTGPAPARVPPSNLIELDIFQSRTSISEYHVDSLLRGLQHNADLTPVLALRRGGRLFLIDGRHRKAAYESAKRCDGIPVEIFTGSTEAAILEGQRRNQMHTLPMTKDERMDCGWKLVKLDATRQCRFSLATIMANAGIGRGQVTTMRRVLRDLGPDGHQHMRWRAALKAYQKKPSPDYTEEDIEAMLDADARALADKMVRTFGTRYADRPEVMVRFIEYYTGRRVQEVSRLLRERNPVSDELGEDDDF